MINIISLPYNKDYPGGPGTFIENLTNELTDVGIEVVNKYYKGQVIIVIVYFNIFKLFIAKFILGKKIILRLDGVYMYKKSSSIKVKFQFLTTLLIYKYLANAIIFQSNYSKLSAIDLFGSSNNKSRLILNGVRTKPLQFKEDVEKDKHIKLVYWASSLSYHNFQNAKIILEAIKSNYSIDFTLIGGDLNSDYDISAYNSCEEIKYLGQLDRDEIYHIGDQFDIFVMFKGSPCPNALLEANSLGLPIVAPDLQGNKELVINDSGIIFKSDYEIPKGEEFINSIELVIENLEYYKNKAYNNYKNNFTSKIMSENYLTFIKEVLEK